MVICAPDGYIVDIFGPYPATMNDASILIDVLNEHTDLTDLLKEGILFCIFKVSKKICVF